MKRPSPGLIVVLAAAAAVHLTVAVLDFPTLARNGFLYDDSFYAFQIARNVAQGNGPTFDGIHLTNGFQPLYVALLVPIFKAAGASETLPIHAALILSALFAVGAAYFLYRLLARRVGDGAACIAAGAWAFSPIVTRQSANGLETALALFMMAGTVLFYLERVRPFAAVPRRRFAMLGLLVGLSALARADLGFLALAMGLDYLVVSRARRRHAWRANAATALAVCATVCLPWLVYGTLAVGSPVPESGRATRFLSLAYAPFFDLAPTTLAQDGPTWSFVSELATRSVASLRVIPVLHPLFRGTQKLADRVAPDAAGTVANLFGLALLAGFVVWWFRRRRSSIGRASREFDFLILFSLMLIGAYSAVIYGVFFFLRYYYPIYFIGMIFAGLAIDDVILWFRQHSLRLRRLALCASGVYAAALMFMGYTSAFRTHPVYRFYDAARWIQTHTDASETIGAFQSGAIGYLSQRRVIDLDGKVNGEAFAALRENRLKDYVSRAGIDLVFDNMTVLDLFLGPWSDAERRRIEAERVFTGGEHGLPGWIGYRLAPPPALNTGSVPAPDPGL